MCGFRNSVAVFTFLSFSICAQQPPQTYDWNLPKGLPAPRVPADNPMSAAKVELGRYLFYDTRMSINGSQACASCHKQQLAFTDGRAVAVGATGEKHPRGAMSLVNVAYSDVLTWSNPALTSLEAQAMIPMFSEHPIELGVGAKTFIATLRADVTYVRLFASAFPGELDPFTIPNVVKAIACFERSIISARSPYDRYHYARDDGAISDVAKRGEVVFFSQPFACFTCHGGFNFAARGAPKIPTLRNIALTAPYMHDGSAPTLAEAVEHNAKGAYRLSDSQRADLVEFLKTLTDEEALHDPRFADPWPAH